MAASTNGARFLKLGAIDILGHRFFAVEGNSVRCAVYRSIRGPVAPPAPSCAKQNCVQTLPNKLQQPKLPLVENHCKRLEMRLQDSWNRVVKGHSAFFCFSPDTHPGRNQLLWKLSSNCHAGEAIFWVTILVEPRWWPQLNRMQILDPKKLWNNKIVLSPHDFWGRGHINTER